MGGCTTMPAFGCGIIAVRGGWGGWRGVGELNNKEHWLRFNNVFNRVLGGVEIAQLNPRGGH